ncbi:hypothetical protein Curi_c23710 [Gottschalkia acidurici 9a]|uniref:VWFA domain-containing protein n=1 Tax=Gottschalkia acidurici (strain ATCC 7906 / DSM 604 / BCRC 14475 / CIP 104303 / KCTC 5404 / NCIMB 10678 / 9a) TaxID=1128398 RepID=K0B498_GOTA9|nr:VWA domain-containing protein [Gottschalkia acidurici]AFS79366.1 hypothetical protein Curi_c23710 [Gottschalkia acidurici 9a]
MTKEIQFKQIVLVTDGESNLGLNPIKVSEDGNKRGITISTIGITSDLEREESITEIKSIAEAGGGIWEHTNIKDLDTTMSMVTMKSVYKTIEEAVNKELKNIVGTELEEMHPSSRKKITDLIDKLGDEVNIECCVVIDCSGSMKDKIDIAKSSVLNLLRILNSRKGKTEISVIGYPYSKAEAYKVLCGFTENIIDLEKGLQKIQIGGQTPTGTALKGAIELLTEDIEYNIDEFEEGILQSSIV